MNQIKLTSLTLRCSFAKTWGKGVFTVASLLLLLATLCSPPVCFAPPPPPPFFSCQDHENSITDQAMRLLRAAAGPQLALNWLKGKHEHS